MTELMLLSPEVGRWRPVPLLPVQQADAVIWSASVVQYSADTGCQRQVVDRTSGSWGEPVYLPQDRELVRRCH